MMPPLWLLGNDEFHSHKRIAYDNVLYIVSFFLVRTSFPRYGLSVIRDLSMSRWQWMNQIGLATYTMHNGVGTHYNI